MFQQTVIQILDNIAGQNFEYISDNNSIEKSISTPNRNDGFQGTLYTEFYNEEDYDADTEK